MVGFFSVPKKYKSKTADGNVGSILCVLFLLSSLLFFNHFQLFGNMFCWPLNALFCTIKIGTQKNAKPLNFAQLASRYHWKLKLLVWINCKKISTYLDNTLLFSVCFPCFICILKAYVWSQVYDICFVMARIPFECSWLTCF